MHIEDRELSLPGLTPLAAYAALRGSACGALIERAGIEKKSKRAFIALDPLRELAIDADPAMLERIRDVFRTYHARCGEVAPGYGLIGTFAYDAALQIIGIQSAHRSDRIFSDAFIFVPGTWLSLDPASGSVRMTAIAASRQESAKLVRRLNDYAARLTRAAHESPAPQQEHSASAAPPVRASFSRARFLDCVAEAKRAIVRGDVYQIVLSIQFSAPRSRDALGVYAALQERNPSPFSYLVERHGCALVGASPEFLVRLRKDRAELRPLAGTRPRGTTPELDEHLARELLDDPKERCEHAMLVDLGRNDLARVCDYGSVRVERAFEIERYSHVMHLASTVSGRLAKGKDAFDLFAATFPAGTVSGAPKRSAMELIDALEPAARDLYAGSVVHAAFDGSFDAALTLRSIVLTPERAIWQSGAGIVNASDPESEYAEIRAKAAIARAVLGVG